MKILLPLIFLLSACTARVVIIAETEDAVLGKTKYEKELENVPQEPSILDTLLTPVTP